MARLVLAFALVGTAAVHAGAVAELDLIFPRINETYKPVYPFPVVFAIRNPGAVWPYNFHFEWTMMPINKRASESDHGRFPLIVDGLSTSGIFEGSDPHYQIYGAVEVFNTTHKEWFIDWGATLLRNCTDNERTATPDQINATTGNFRFYFDKENGKLPDIYQPDASASSADADADSGCPRPLWTVNLSDESRPDSGCVRLDLEDPYPEPSPCAVRPTEELAANVTAEMLRTAMCVGVTEWPSEELTGYCGDEDWSPSLGSKAASSIGTAIPLVATLLVVTYWMF